MSEFSVEFNIYLSDLTEEAQKRFLEFNGCENEADGNWDIIPIGIFMLEKETDNEI